MEGIVEAIHLHEELSQDFTITLMPRVGPTLWRVELDHVTQIAVAVVDKVCIGDILCYPGGGCTDAGKADAFHGGVGREKVGTS
jgi:hypothetical protein